MNSYLISVTSNYGYSFKKHSDPTPKDNSAVGPDLLWLIKAPTAEDACVIVRFQMQEYLFRNPQFVNVPGDVSGYQFGNDKLSPSDIAVVQIFLQRVPLCYRITQVQLCDAM